MSIEESINVLEKLAVHQYGKKHVEFFQKLYDICEKKSPKRNCMYLLGPANSGKTWFMNCVTSLYLNVGYVRNPVRGEHFPYNDCVNRRILLWNEPCVMTSALEDVKMLAGGDPLAVNVKYESNSTVTVAC